ncbi:hypothetical protein F5884DRAFT_708286 [Xylogone sp. PMI_703]|nr:hypothetical protein F5884DRAFT_708286 [Xylogone sp. PMI_703]
MSTSDMPPEGYPAEIIGYVEPWIASPGDTIDVKVSSTEAELKYHFVRMIHGPQGTDFSGMKQEVVTEIPSGNFKGRYQVAHPGSYAIMDERDYQVQSTGVEFTLYFQSTLPGAKHFQTIVSTLNIPTKTGYAVVLTVEGLVEFWIGTGKTVEVISTTFKATSKRWTELRFTIQDAILYYGISPRSSFAEPPGSPVKGHKHLNYEANISDPCILTFATSFAKGPDEASTHPTNFFNGRLDSPTMKRPSGSDVLAKWDFSINMSGDEISDVSKTGANGRLVNAPTRAVTGYDWDGTESDWTKARFGYGAIHFHEDDLDDAGWDTDFSVSLPELRSGVYTIHIEATDGKVKDMVPFYIRPTVSTSAKLGAKVAYIISTFTYLAYGNEHVYDRAELMRSGGYTWSVRRDEHARKIERRLDLGLSCYDVYNDRSGVIHSTAKRPILNMRPDYISWNFHRPRGLSADLIMLEFLEKSGIPYDVICDHDLHTFGMRFISHYGTIITGSHPEYHTVESLTAYSNYIKSGGNIMYLGGNGFYWSCATQQESLHRVEIRRGDQGCRAFTLGGGDRIFTNGQQGLLWRSRGVASNYLFGIGSCGCGEGPGVPYKRTDASKDVALAWMFKGISEDELLGEYGFGGGASGDEIDRCDYRLGSPYNTIVVATSTGHPDEFGIFPEDVEFPVINTLGTQTEDIRSDVVYYESAGGGAVFSVGSINWFCSLGWNNFQNNIARLTDNVLREFVSRHK